VDSVRKLSCFVDPLAAGDGSLERRRLRLGDQRLQRKGCFVDLPNLPPLFVYGAILVGFVVTNLLLAHTLGPRKHTPVKDMPYESGMDPIGDARQPFDVRFYLVAILFLVFDVELLFLYPWAVSAYSELGIPPELRDTVFGVMLVFMATLALAWVYAWRKGVFRWR